MIAKSGSNEPLSNCGQRPYRKGKTTRTENGPSYVRHVICRSHASRFASRRESRVKSCRKARPAGEKSSSPTLTGGDEDARPAIHTRSKGCRDGNREYRLRRESADLPDYLIECPHQLLIERGYPPPDPHSSICQQLGTPP